MNTKKVPFLSRFERAVPALVAALYTGLISLALLDVLIFFERTDFDSKKVMPLPQGALLLLGVAGLLLSAWLIGRGGERLPAPARPARRRLAPWALFWGALFFLQCAMAYFSYFLTDWDSQTVTSCAYAIATGYRDIDYYYYYMNPNNAAVTLLYAAIMKLFWLVAPSAGFDRHIYILIVFQCAINTCAGMLTQRLAVRLTHSRRFGLLSALGYVAFIGLSPWSTVPYSDATALILPIALLNLYELARSGAHKRLCWLGIALVTALSFLVKPQSGIVCIAILLLDGVRLLSAGRWRAYAARLACVLVITCLSAGPGIDLIYKLSPLKQNKDWALGMLHYAMLGLNEETNGSYYLDDVYLSTSVATKAERTALQLQTIRERIAEKDARRWANHLVKKTLTNYADGTFAWGIEGVFFYKPIADKDAVLSPFLKDLFNSDTGKRYPALQGWYQAIWLGLLFLSLPGALSLLKAQDSTERQILLIMLLSVCGLTLFETIFEARARYLLTFAPIYLLLGLRGAWGVQARLSRRSK